MHNRHSSPTLDRRTVLISTAVVLMPSLATAAPSPSLERSQLFLDDFARLSQGKAPTENGVMVDLPETAENGNFVPITIAVESPMTDKDYVKSIHILSTANPVAHVATFSLSPLNALARVQSRMRLAKTQDVIVLATLSTGQMLMSTTRVNVTIGGCGG